MSLHDSGDRTTYESGAMRDRAPGKGRYDALQVFALRRIAMILEAADTKYGDCRNWEKGMPLSRFIDSAMRHLCQHMEGRTDEDHLGQAAWNLLSALQTEEMIKRRILPAELDDMPKYFVRNQPDPFQAQEDRVWMLDHGCIEWSTLNENGVDPTMDIYWVLPQESPENFDDSQVPEFFHEARKCFGNDVDLIFCVHAAPNAHPPGFHLASIKHPRAHGIVSFKRDND